jgi:hypothetical protein
MALLHTLENSLALALALTASACATSQEVKVASQKVTQTFDSLEGAEATFQQQLVAEIERTRQQVARAIVATAVNAKLKAIANDLEAKGDLIDLAFQIGAAESQAKALVGILLSTNAPKDEGADIAIWLKSSIDGADAALAMSDLSESTKAQLAARLEELKSADAALPSVSKADLRVLLRLSRMVAAAKGDMLVQLHQHLATVRALHAQLDTWIQTDATVKGEDLAKLAEQATKQLAASGAQGAKP